MASRSSSIATAFVWAVGMAASYGISGSLVFHEKRDQVANNAGVAAVVAAAVGYAERRRSPSLE